MGYVEVLSSINYLIGVDTNKTFTVPTFTFTTGKYCNGPETLTVTKSDGTALPAWVTFNSGTRVVTINTSDTNKHSITAESYKITSTLFGGAVKTIDWSVTFTDPCVGTTFTALTIPTITVTIGGSQTYDFAEPVTAAETTHKSGVIGLCGTRSYSIVESNGTTLVTSGMTVTLKTGSTYTITVTPPTADDGW